MKKILIVEDEREIQELLSAYLRSDGYEVTQAVDGMEAVDLFNEGIFDLILLDVMLPKIDGFGVCELIRRKSDIPIIMLTALDGEAEQIKGFDLKIDDYVTKPFSMPVLLKKIAAILRRSCGDISQNLLCYEGLVLNIDKRECEYNSKVIDLTQKEFDLLYEILKASGKVLSRDILLNRLWGYDFFGEERIVDSHIKNLRKKINIDCIETIRGVGYRAAKKN